MVADAIRASLAEQHLEVADVHPWGDDCVEVDVIDAHPEIQRAVSAVTKPHQRGHTNTSIDVYISDNRRIDIPQVRTVLVNFKWTKELYQRAIAAAERTFSNFHDTQLNEVEYVQKLLRGSFPQFWTDETEAAQDSRCCAYQLPIQDTGTPWSCRIIRNSEHPVYQCEQCGDFHPTPAVKDR